MTMRDAGRQILMAVVLAGLLAGCDRSDARFTPALWVGAILLTLAAMLALWRYSAYSRRENRRDDRAVHREEPRPKA